MALMKIGRKGDPTRKKSTWEDVENNEKAKVQNASALSTYDQQSKFYNKNKNAGVRDYKTNFAGGGRYLNPQELKKWNSTMPYDTLERAGLESEKVYVPKAFNFETMSTKTFSHDFYKKPEKPKVIAEIPINRDDLDLPKMAINKPGVLPTKTRGLKQAPEKVKADDFSIQKPAKFGGKSLTTQAPSLNRRKAVKREDDVKFGTGVNSGSGMSGVKRLAYAAVANPINKIRFNKEVRQGKAYFGSNEGASSADLKISRTNLKSDKLGLKQAIKDVRKGTKNVVSTDMLTKKERISGYRGEIKSLNSELKTNRQAGKYLKDLRLGGNYMPGATTNENTSIGLRSGKIQFATPEAFKGYTKTKKSKK